MVRDGKESTFNAVAAPAERRVLARRGWVGENSVHFEHPAGVC